IEDSQSIHAGLRMVEVGSPTCCDESIERYALVPRHRSRFTRLSAECCREQSAENSKTACLSQDSVWQSIYHALCVFEIGNLTVKCFVEASMFGMLFDTYPCYFIDH